MKIITALITISVGIYAFIRNNIFYPNGELWFSPNHNLLFKFIIPILIAAIGILILRPNRPIKITALIILGIDACFRIYEITKFPFLNFRVSTSDASGNQVIITYSLLPSYILFLLVIISIAFIFKLKIKNDRIARR